MVLLALLVVMVLIQYFQLLPLLVVEVVEVGHQEQELLEVQVVAVAHIFLALTAQDLVLVQLLEMVTHHL
tara:strand:+ start:118 stop:327 length:210 start_codon:yes stop_codon:yes gene_type:complete